MHCEYFCIRAFVGKLLVHLRSLSPRKTRREKQDRVVPLMQVQRTRSEAGTNNHLLSNVFDTMKYTKAATYSAEYSESSSTWCTSRGGVQPRCRFPACPAHTETRLSESLDLMMTTLFDLKRWKARRVNAVSYTHLTLPTRRTV